MCETNNESSNTIIELEIKLFNLLEIAFFIVKANLIWINAKVYNFCKIDYFMNLVRVLVCNLKARLNNNNTQRKNLLEWIRTKVKGPHSPKNFSEDWKDGIALCALIEGVVPGSCPRFDLLNPEQPINNINLGLTLIKKHLNIDSTIESHEIHDCSEEAKLVYFLTRIKFESVKMLMKSLLSRSIIEVKDSSGNCHKAFESLFGDEKACFAKGMGLILGVRTRRARFNIFCKPTPKLNLMIEISGPNNSICSEKITVYNPKKRISADVVTTALIADVLNRRKHCEENLKIPFFYEVFPNKIVVTYIPLMKGPHKLSIIWQGQHIMHSPYTVNVEDTVNDIGRAPETPQNITSPTKFLPGLQYPVNALAKRDSLCFDETATVVGRKVLKQTIIINGKEKVISDHKTDIIHNNSNQINYTSNDNIIKNIPKFDNKQNDFDIRAKSSLDVKYENQVLHSRNNSIYNDLSDIIETDSIHSELSSPKCIKDLPNNENISEVNMDKNQPNSVITETEAKESINKINYLTESEILDKNSDPESNDLFDKCVVNNDIKEDEMFSSLQQMVTKPSLCENGKVINNFSNRSFLPVKNMIQNWETKLSNNVNKNNITEKNKRNKVEGRIQFIPVKRKELSRYFSINDKKQFWEGFTSDSLNIQQIEKFDNLVDKQIVTELNENKCDQSFSPIDNVNEVHTEDSEDLLKASSEMLSSQTIVNTPESQPDSGISTNTFCNLKNKIFNQKSYRQKSHSYPDIHRLTNFDFRELDFLKDEEHKNNTRTSSLSGQFIDDEIPDYSSLFLGEYVSYTGLLNTDRPMTLDDIKFDDIVDNQQNNNAINNDNLNIYPEKCQVFGAGVYYGQVGVKNHFVVSTKNSGKSYLSVGIQSAEQEDVIEVTVSKIGDGNYEALYEVSHPGYYIIFVKWGDYNIADSPFICKVTF